MKKIFFFILFLVVFLLSYSQYDNLHFSAITAEDGLSQSWVRCIHQDRHGYMWFGTKDGLNRYDGYNFKIFRYEENNPSSINNVTVNVIHELPDGNMLIGTAHGVDLYLHNLESFEHQKHLPDDDILCILVDRNSNFWLGTNTGLYCFNTSDSILTHYTYQQNNDRSLSNHYVQCLFEDSQNNLWVGTRDGLNLFHEETGTFTRYYNHGRPTDLSSDYIFTIIEDNAGRLWVGSMTGGLDLFVNSKERPEKGKFKNYLSGSIWHFLIDQRNHLWMGRGGGQGLSILDLNSVDKDLKVYHYDHEMGNSNSLSDNSLDCVYEDKWGDIWIGTYGKGINYNSRRSKKFHTVTHIPGNINTISNNHVNVFYDDKEFFWIGTEGGLNRLDKKTGKYKYFERNDNVPGSIGANAIYSIYKDSRGNLWIGTWTGGLNLYNYSTETFRKYIVRENDSASIGSNHVFSIFEDNRRNLWLGTIGGGLNRYDYTANSFIRYANNPSDSTTIATNFINSICQTKYGDLWISTHDKLDLFNYEKNIFHHYSRDQYIGPGMSSADILVLFVDSKDKLWLGTESGLVLYDKFNNTFVRYTTEHGLPNNTIKGILEDDMGNLWISTNNGITKFEKGVSVPKRPVFKNYDRNDGLQGNEFVKRSAYKDNSGYLYFGGTNGYTYFHPDSIKDNTVIPPLVLTDLRLFNKSVRENKEYAYLLENMNKNKQVVIPYKQSVFSIEYAALNYLNSKKNKYRYKLEGFNEEWINAGHQRTTTYTHLDPGRYIFRLQGSNNDGIWNSEGISLEIIVLPPWWKTLFFRILLALSLFVLLYVLYRLRLYRLHVQKIHLEKMVDERTVELLEANSLLEEKQEEITKQNYELANHRNNLESLVNERTRELEDAKKKAEESERLKSAFLANMSHEIRTPMNAIVGFATLLHDEDVDDKKRDYYINIIEKNSEALLVLINDILEISLIEARQIKIYKKEFEVNSILSELEKFYCLRNDKDIDINYIRNSENKNIVLNNDPIRFRQVMSNLLTNALKYTEKGHIHFGYHLVDKVAQFYVEDTGRGIDEKEFDNIFNYFHKIDDDTKLYRGAGIGLSITQNLVELMGGKIWLESEIQEGTIFYFTMPISRIKKVEETSKKEIIGVNWNLKDYTIFVAEDETTNFKLIQNIMERTHAEVIWAKNGKEIVTLIHHAENLRNCIILMDIKMPVMDGIQALKEIRKRNIKIPVIAVTAYANESEKTEIMKNDFDDYIAKPLKPVKLLELISKYIK